MLHLEHSFVWC